MVSALPCRVHAACLLQLFQGLLPWTSNGSQTRPILPAITYDHMISKASIFFGSLVAFAAQLRTRWKAHGNLGGWPS